MTFVRRSSRISDRRAVIFLSLPLDCDRRSLSEAVERSVRNEVERADWVVCSRSLHMRSLREDDNIERPVALSPSDGLPVLIIPDLAVLRLLDFEPLLVVLGSYVCIPACDAAERELCPLPICSGKSWGLLDLALNIVHPLDGAWLP
jgi:hypothetical protein